MNYIPGFQRQRRFTPRPNAAPEVVEAFRAQHPDIAAWLDEGRMTGFEFALSLHGALNRYGKLTDNQINAAYRCIEKKRTALADRMMREAAAPTVSIVAIETAFAAAKVAGLKRPKLRFAEFAFSPAGANSVNPGAVYVKSLDGTYLGKIANGKFVRARECDDETETAILTVCMDPHTAAVAYGKRFGVCSACGRALTDARSIDAGIGPVCAKAYGWVR